MTAFTAAPRHRGLPAYKWDGSEEDAQGLALWLLEHNARPKECRFVRYHGVTFHKGYIALNGAEVLPGEWIIIQSRRVLMQMDEDQFGEAYQLVEEITIKEIR